MKKAMLQRGYSLKNSSKIFFQCQMQKERLCKYWSSASDKLVKLSVITLDDNILHELMHLNLSSSITGNIRVLVFKSGNFHCSEVLFFRGPLILKCSGYFIEFNLFPVNYVDSGARMHLKGRRSYYFLVHAWVQPILK